MGPTIAVGLESTVDVLITFPELADLEEFASDYEGGLSGLLEKAVDSISAGSGGEIPIDGRGKEAEVLIRSSSERGAEIGYSFGGNGAQEAATLERLGAETVFLGGIFPKSFSELGGSGQDYFGGTDLRFAQYLREYRPASYIFQASGTDRYILTDGEGRRIDQLRSYIENLPEVVSDILEEYGDLDALSLVGWQVLFGNGLGREDYQLVESVLREIREKTDALLFTDAGGVGGLGEEDKSRLWKIYSMFDILSLNGDELSQICGILDAHPEERLPAMKTLVGESKVLSSVWLHTPHYQATLSSDFSRDLIEKAQDRAALAGLYKVENGDYPSWESLTSLKDSRGLSELGEEKKLEFLNRYGNEVDDFNFVVNPSYKAEEFVSTVGAGDVSAATYLYVLAESEISPD